MINRLKLDSNRNACLLLGLVTVIFPGTGYAENIQTRRFDCDNTAGWVGLSSQRQRLGEDALSADNGILSFSYQRSDRPVLMHAAAIMTGLEGLSLRLRSDHDVLLQVSVADRDGATFQARSALKAGAWVTVNHNAENFRLSDSSPVKKGKLQAIRLGRGYTLSDVSTRTVDGKNTIEIDFSILEYAPLPVQSGDLVITEDSSISASQVRDGNIVVKEGANVRITAGKLEVHGDLTIQGGSVEIAGGALVMPQRFNHERNITLSSSARLKFKDALFGTSFPLMLSVNDQCALELENTTVAGIISCNVRTGSSVTLRKMDRPGEFMLSPGSRFSASESTGVMLWLFLGGRLKDELVLPGNEEIREWSPKPVLDLELKQCRSVQWGIVPLPGSKGVVVASELRAVGFPFFGDTNQTLRNIHNGQVPEGGDLGIGDRDVRFKVDNVVAWNFYAGANARLMVENCTFGEVFLSGQAHMTVRDSTCDGKGGYMRAGGNSTLEMMGCTLTSRLVATNDANVSLQDCKVEGDVHATGKSTIKLVKTEVQGQIVGDPPAKVVHE